MIFITGDLPKSNPKKTINNEIIAVYAYLFNPFVDTLPRHLVGDFEVLLRGECVRSN